MTGTSKNLGMTTYSTSADAASVLVYSYIDQSSACSPTSNLGIMDRFAGEISASMVVTSASITQLRAISGSTKSAVIQIVAYGTDVDASNGVFYFRVPTELNGRNITRAYGFVDTVSAGSSGSTTIQIRNMTKYAGNDTLIRPIIIPYGTTTGSDATISSSYDDVSTDDKLKIYVTDFEVTKPQGLQVSIDFQ